MKREFITISGLKKILSPKEMKNVFGGSVNGPCSYCGYYTYDNGQTIYYSGFGYYGICEAYESDPGWDSFDCTCGCQK